MATDEDIKDETTEQVEETEAPEETSVETEHDAPVAGGLGAARYVHAAFFLIAILGAYVGSKVLVMAWVAVAVRRKPCGGSVVIAHSAIM